MTSQTEDRKVQKLLFDAAVEIASHDGADSRVFHGLLSELQQHAQPLSTTIGEIARFYDIPPADALDEVMKIGCRVFWWNGKPYEAAGIRQQIKEAWQWDITPEIEIDLKPDERQRLDAALEGNEPVLDEVPSQATGKPPRKFAASQPELPTTAAEPQRRQLG